MLMGTEEGVPLSLFPLWAPEQLPWSCWEHLFYSLLVPLQRVPGSRCRDRLGSQVQDTASSPVLPTKRWYFHSCLFLCLFLNWFIMQRWASDIYKLHMTGENSQASPLWVSQESTSRSSSEKMTFSSEVRVCFGWDGVDHIPYPNPLCLSEVVG